jgi:hypothetical protein
LRRYVAELLILAVGVLALTPDHALAVYAPTATHGITDTAANVPSDSTFTYAATAGNELSRYVGVRPPSGVAIAPGPGNPGNLPGVSPALGEIAGSITRNWTLGVSGGACSSPVTLTFPLMNSTVNTEQNNRIYPSSPGETNSEGPLSPLLRDVNLISPSPANGDGGSDGGAFSPPNNLPGYVDRYPAYLTDILWPITPLARYSGGGFVMGRAVIVDLVFFQPGSGFPSDPLAALADTYVEGYIGFIIVNGGQPLGGSVTGECTPESYSAPLHGESRNNECVADLDPGLHCSNTVAGINNPPVGPNTGLDRYRNPLSTGSHQWSMWAQSVAGSEASASQSLTVSGGTIDGDFDGDGIQDAVDGRRDGTAFWNQSLVKSGAFDDGHLGGMAHGSIGPPTTFTVVDHAVGVRVTNTSGSSSLTTFMCGQQSYLTLSPGDDAIVNCGSVIVEVLIGPVTEKFGTITATLPTGTTSTVADVGSGNYEVTNSALSAAAINVGGLSVAPGETVVVFDTDGDSTIDQLDPCPSYASFWPVPAGDTDCDGFTDANENQIGTDPALPCAATMSANDEPPPDRWPVDFGDNRFANTLDIGSYVPRLNKKDGVDPQYNIRWDLTFNGVINTADVGRFVPFLNKSCTP